MRDLTPTELRLVKKAVREAYEKGRRAERREFDAFLTRMRVLKELNGSADAFLKAYSPGEKAKGRAVEMEHTDNPAEADRIAADHLAEDPDYYTKLDAAGLGHGDDNPHDLVAEAMLAHAEESMSTGADPLPGLDRLRGLLDDPAALAELLGQSGADDATVGKCFRVLKAWDESKHPRAASGHFISKDRIEAAKSDPKLAKELRKEVKPEDAGKLDAALEGKTDLGRTKRGQAKHEAAQRRATKDEAKAKTQEFLAHFRKVGDLKADLTADHLYDLAEHLKSEYVTIDDVRQLRTALHGAGGGKASFGGQRKRQALVDALRDHARGRGLKERAKELGLDGGELSAAVGTRDAGEPAPVAPAERQAPATTGQYGAWGRAAAGEGPGAALDKAPKGEPAPAAAPAGPAADEAELAALNRTPAKKLTPAQKKRKDQLSREFTARKFPGATPVMMGGGKGPGVSDAENEATAAKPAPTTTATTVDTPTAADYSSDTPAPGTGGTQGGGPVETTTVVKTARQKFDAASRALAPLAARLNAAAPGAAGYTRLEAEYAAADAAVQAARAEKEAAEAAHAAARGKRYAVYHDPGTGTPELLSSHDTLAAAAAAANGEAPRLLRDVPYSSRGTPAADEVGTPAILPAHEGRGRKVYVAEVPHTQGGKA